MSERINIVIAMMKMEVKFGDEETQEKFFEKTKIYIDPELAYIHQADIYGEADFHEKALEYYKMAVKKFGKESEQIYHRYFIYLLKKEMFKEANDVLQIALNKLPRDKRKKLFSFFGNNI